MKRIILFLFICFNCLNQIASAQENLRPNLLKYWYYRDRLKYFVVPGTNQGESEIVCLRNIIKQVKEKSIFKNTK